MKKTLYFTIAPNKELETIYKQFKLYGPIIEFKCKQNQKPKLGNVTFQYCEDALLVKSFIEQNLDNDYQIKISFKEFEYKSKSDKDISFFLKQVKSSNLELLKPLQLKKGNELSIFLFDIPKEVDENFINGLFEKKNCQVTFDTKLDYNLNPSLYAIVTFERREDKIKIK